MEKYDVYNQSGRKVGEIERRESGGVPGCGGCLWILVGCAIALMWWFYLVHDYSGMDPDQKAIYPIGIAAILIDLIIHGSILSKQKREDFFATAIMNAMLMMISATIVCGIVMAISYVIYHGEMISEILVQIIPGCILGFLLAMAPTVIAALIVTSCQKSN